MIMLKQSTAVTLKFGPFVDETDGKTAETGLTITQPDVRLSKNGANMIQKSAAGTAAHDEIGFYDVSLSTTDTGTLGTLLVAVHESGALPVFQYFQVVPANAYNSLVAGSDDLDVALSTQGKTDVNAEVDTALADYDGPTKAEMDTGHGLLATEAKQDTIDALVDAIKAVTDLLPDAGALSDIATILVDTGTTLQAELDGIQVDTEDIQTRLPAALTSGLMNSNLERWRDSIPLITVVGLVQTWAQTFSQALIDAIADTTLQRPTSDIEAGWTADHRTLYGVIASLMHKAERDGGDNNIILYESDDTTILVTIPITKDSGLDPISIVDPPA